MEGPKNNYDFYHLINRLERLLEETNHDKTILEEQCEDVSSVLQPWKVEKSSTSESVINEDFEKVSEKECLAEIDEATNLQINRVIEKARTVRKQVITTNNKIRNVQTVKTSVKSSVLKINKNSEKNSAGKESETNNIPIPRASSSTSDAIKTNKSPCSINTKTPPSTISHFQTSYHKHFSSVTKSTVKSSPKIDTKNCKPTAKTSPTASGGVKNYAMRDKNSVHPNTSGPSKLLKTTSELESNNVNFKTWNKPRPETEEKSMEEAVRYRGIPYEVSHVLKLYHQYLKGMDSKKEVMFRSKFMEQFDQLNNGDSQTKSEKKLLLQEQLNKYSALYKDMFINEDDSSKQDCEHQMFTSYGRVEKWKLLEQKLLKLQTLKIQLELFDIMLNHLKTVCIDKEEAAIVYKTLSALCDIKNLSVPVVFKKP